jgi:hypothetical protein
VGCVAVGPGTMAATVVRFDDQDVPGRLTHFALSADKAENGGSVGSRMRDRDACHDPSTSTAPGPCRLRLQDLIKGFQALAGYVSPLQDFVKGFQIRV